MASKMVGNSPGHPDPKSIATYLEYTVCMGIPSLYLDYRKTSNIRRTLVGNKLVDHSDVVGESPVGATPTTSSFST